MENQKRYVQGGITIGINEAVIIRDRTRIMVRKWPGPADQVSDTNKGEIYIGIFIECFGRHALLHNQMLQGLLYVPPHKLDHRRTMRFHWNWTGNTGQQFIVRSPLLHLMEPAATQESNFRAASGCQA